MRGRFREDLYYRIRGVEVALPPLRERGDDILLLARTSSRRERETSRRAVAISRRSRVDFSRVRWPGNVRELQNTIRAAHAIAGDAKEIASSICPSDCASRACRA